MKLKLFLLTVLSILLITANGFCAGVEITWNPNPEIDNVTGYNIYVGMEEGAYPNPPIDAGKVTKYIYLTPEESTKYFFVITAYDAAGNESVGSVEVSATTLDLTAPSTPTGVKCVAVK